jgi:hypothetical protein
MGIALLPPDLPLKREEILRMLRESLEENTQVEHCVQ